MTTFLASLFAVWAFGFFCGALVVAFGSREEVEE